MSTIEEVLYLIQHSTGIKPCGAYKQMVKHSLYLEMDQQELVNDLIVMIHENSRNYRPNPNLRSCDW